MKETLNRQSSKSKFPRVALFYNSVVVHVVWRTNSQNITDQTNTFRLMCWTKISGQQKCRYIKYSRKLRSISSASNFQFVWPKLIRNGNPQMASKDVRQFHFYRRRSGKSIYFRRNGCLGYNVAISNIWVCNGGGILSCRISYIPAIQHIWCCGRGYDLPGRE